MASALDHLQDTVWKHPDYYAGYSPEGECVLAARHRDSCLLDRHNWETIYEEVARACPSGQDVNDYLYDFRAGHCLVGWVEYLMLKPDAPQEMLEAADECLRALAYYPILDEMAYSYRVYEEMNDYWDRLSLSERVDLCRDYNVSIFAARSERIPDGSRDYNDGIYEFIRMIVEE